ncbi:hypothetical protein GGI15_001738 [Coemansia interrupta]|uniref:Mitochondrial carrier n=1 Tax=Coemansia interrupta TaxID=1126814 RepID=A0A9W8LMJ2_9FUNG|nr:hypothetical protein GGI15_001738 [Coemansia interrupta]
MVTKHKDAPLHSLLAGTLAGAVEGAATYPTELLKTKMQLQGSASYLHHGGQSYASPLSCLRHTIKTDGLLGLYRGLTPMLLGNALKAGVRFLTYDTIKQRLRDHQGNLTMPRMLCAGMLAGTIEGLTVVAPTEAIKTRLIHDHCLPPGRRAYGGAMQCLGEVWRERALWRGVGPVMARQGANSCVRFATYDSLKQGLQGATGRPVTGAQAFGLGMCAGVVTVYATMPLDVVKTRMQGSGEHGSALRCARTIVGEEGPRALWKGATPRLARLMFSGAIVFSVYEEVIKFLR